MAAVEGSGLCHRPAGKRVVESCKFLGYAQRVLRLTVVDNIMELRSVQQRSAAWRYLLVTGLLLWFSGCAVLKPDPAAQLPGDWQGSLAGFPVVLHYTATGVVVGDNPEVPYKLDGDRLTFQDGGTQLRLLSFPSRDEMIQTDPLTGSEHHFKRLNSN
ncbi:MAG: hypothetical protein KDI36_16335 [Pseudomonadales bacterium]|nr:hypothetical protein [Pseudomonadales bacterium]